AILSGRMAARDHLYTDAAELTEFVEQGAELYRCVVVSAGMRDDGPPSGTSDPVHRLLQRRPLHGYVSRAAVSQITIEHCLKIAGITALHQVPREMGTADERGVADILQGAFVAILHAHRIETPPTLTRTRRTSHTDTPQTFHPAVRGSSHSDR